MPMNIDSSSEGVRRGLFTGRSSFALYVMQIDNPAITGAIPVNLMPVILNAWFRKYPKAFYMAHTVLMFGAHSLFQY